MAQDSRTVPLSSVTTWLSGGTPNRAIDAYWGGSIPWISAATLKRSKIDDSDQYLTDLGVRVGSKMAPAGSTLMLVRGMALHHETRLGMATRPVSFNQDVKALIPKNGLSAEFLMYSLQSLSSRILDLVSSAGSGTGVLNTELLKRLPLWIPSETDQSAIVTAIESADDTIEALERLIAKKQAIKQATMQRILTGKSRLPGFTGPWGSATIGELCALRSGTPKKRETGGRYWVVDMGSVTRAAELIVTRTTNDSAGPLRHGELVMPKDDIGGGNIIGRTGLIERSDTYVLADHVYALTPRNVDPSFLNFAINGYMVNSSLRSKATGSAQLGLSKKSVLDQEVTHPSEIEEQRAIAAVLTDSGREIALLRVRLRKARAVKIGMMQQLLTGRARLSVEDAS